MVGLHVPYDRSGHSDDKVLRRGDQQCDQEFNGHPLHHLDAHSGSVAGDDYNPRVCTRGPVSERHLDRYNGQEAQDEQPAMVS